jgi:hypothetical protein
MSHNSSISEMGEPVLAIRVINEKQMLLIMVGINIMLIGVALIKSSKIIY